MFQFFKKKNEVIYAPCSGRVIPITEVKDPVFSQKLLGDGFAIIPDSEKITAPFTGQVVAIFPTKHAISLKTESGINYLIHIGIDTVKLNGEPFSIFIKENDKVKHGDLIAEVDFEQITRAKKDPSIIIIFTEGNQINNLKTNNEVIENNQPCGECYL
ncbi:PTS sugar transporter subunit IIA [Enterococcus lactis]|uniref:PTS sugar transporter subunit IIA n=1 Tax=Enterococcus lactis TaxID=357441 RepID=UPI00404145D0